MKIRENACLQCMESREIIEHNNYFCVALTGYETVEIDDEWDEHHCQEWSDAEMKEFKIHPDLWEDNRRTDHGTLSEFIFRESVCLSRGQHSLDMSEYGPGTQCCICCWSGNLTDEEIKNARRV